jgi:hypothetical protein
MVTVLLQHGSGTDGLPDLLNSNGLAGPYPWASSSRRERTSAGDGRRLLERDRRGHAGDRVKKIARAGSEETGLQGSLGLEENTKIGGLGTPRFQRWDPFESFEAQSNACGAQESQDSADANDRRPTQPVRQVPDGTTFSSKERKAPSAPTTVAALAARRGATLLIQIMAPGYSNAILSTGVCEVMLGGGRWLSCFIATRTVPMRYPRPSPEVSWRSRYGVGLSGYAACW